MPVFSLLLLLRSLPSAFVPIPVASSSRFTDAPREFPATREISCDAVRQFCAQRGRAKLRRSRRQVGVQKSIAFWDLRAIRAPNVADQRQKRFHRGSRLGYFFAPINPT
jgi:hypothetical protein